MSENNLEKLLENVRNVKFSPNNVMESFYEQYKEEITKNIYDKLKLKSMIGFEVRKKMEGIFYYVDKGSMESQEVNPKNDFVFKAVASFDAFKYLKDQFGISAQKEYVDILSNEIAMELDRRAFANMRRNCTNKLIFDFDSDNLRGNTLNDKVEFLHGEILTMSRKIGFKTELDPANFIICSPEIADILLEREKSELNSLNTEYAGTLANRWAVYEDPLHPPKHIMIGYYGESRFFCGMTMSCRTLFELENKETYEQHGELFRISADFSLNVPPNGGDFYGLIELKNCPF